MSVAARHLQLITVKQLIVDAGFPFQTVIFRTVAVLVITEHRMSFRRQMGADLVALSCDEPDL